LLVGLEVWLLLLLQIPPQQVLLEQTTLTHQQGYLQLVLVVEEEGLGLLFLGGMVGLVDSQQEVVEVVAQLKQAQPLVRVESVEREWQS
jgi:hypothetical protein